MSVAAGARRPRAPPFPDRRGYARHRPGTTLPYQPVERHGVAFRTLRGESGTPLPGYVEQEFEAYLKSGRLEPGFLRVRCAECHAEKPVAFSCRPRVLPLVRCSLSRATPCSTAGQHAGPAGAGVLRGQAAPRRTGVLDTPGWILARLTG